MTIYNVYGNMHMLSQNKDMKTNTTGTLSELQDFVTHQAAEDAVLPPSERSYQEKLVADVLGQEAPNDRAFKRLIKLYRSEKQAA